MDCDCVFTGEGQIDKSTQYGKVPYGVLKIAKEYMKDDCIIVNLSGRKGKKTTTPGTYVAANGQPALHNAQDIFVTKHVSRRRIETSSGGGGGGSHSTGGHSFGGGGGRH